MNDYLKVVEVCLSFDGLTGIKNPAVADWNGYRIFRWESQFTFSTTRYVTFCRNHIGDPPPLYRIESLSLLEVLRWIENHLDEHSHSVLS